METILHDLLSFREDAYRAFTSPLIPNIDPECILGVRTPILRALAKKWKDTPQAEAFVRQLPHRYLEENTLHGFLIGEIQSFDRCMGEVETFLPYVDNWATCDSLRPRCFGKNRSLLLERIPIWLTSPHPYTVRFAMEMLMVHFLEDSFFPESLAWVAQVDSEEYYVKMMAAWYFATALAKQWDRTIPYLEENRLSPWIHQKTIQKATESYRIPDNRKQYLRSLRKKTV